MKILLEELIQLIIPTKIKIKMKIKIKNMKVMIKVISLPIIKKKIKMNKI